MRLRTPRKASRDPCWGNRDSEREETLLRPTKLGLTSARGYGFPPFYTGKVFLNEYFRVFLLPRMCCQVEEVNSHLLWVFLEPDTLYA